MILFCINSYPKSQSVISRCILSVCVNERFFKRYFIKKKKTSLHISLHSSNYLIIIHDKISRNIKSVLLTLQITVIQQSNIPTMLNIYARKTVWYHLIFTVS